VKLLHFYTPTGIHMGARIESGVVDLPQALSVISQQGVPATLIALFSGGPAAQTALDGYIQRISPDAPGASWLLDEKTIHFAPCVPNPGKIICIGLNYRRHAAESGLAVPATPVIFSKFNNTLAAHGEPVKLDQVAEQYDYEAELVVVMGRSARFVPENKALETVFGYCNGNDLSTRELQTRTSQWLLGKTQDKFFPTGPYLVTSDQVRNADALRIRCWLNGELRQDSNTSDMVFSVPQLVSYISQYLTLEPGDLISTGTPEGVILGRKEKVWMKPGDIVEVEVEGLGKLRNPMC
jgi:2-keto-4-pentenoate hydratase/2-oxohepta-3-ene-1,7-dioic acid hydratase in catechol pathway